MISGEQMTRMLHVIRGMRPESGGPLEGVLRISEVLQRDGHETEIVSIESEEEVARRWFPCPVTALGAGIGRYGYNPRLVPWLHKNASRFDAVILHGLWNYSSLGSWLALRNHPTPYYIFSHGMMSPWFRDHFPLKHFVKQTFWTLAEGRVLQDAKSVLFTCDEECLHARNVFRGHPYKECVVGYGAPDPPGDPALDRAAFLSAFPALKDKQFLLFLGRIHQVKACDLLVEAFAQCLPQLPLNLDLVIAGPDQVGWTRQLKAQAEKLGVSVRVHWLGMVGGNIKFGAYRCAEALILPSHHENFGLVVAEAMACSTPVLISDKVNIWREVQMSRAGFVEPDTLDGVRHLIRRFVALSTDERAEFSRHARQGYLRHFDVTVAARTVVRLIQDERATAHKVV